MAKKHHEEEEENKIPQDDSEGFNEMFGEEVDEYPAGYFPLEDELLDGDEGDLDTDEEGYY